MKDFRNTIGWLLEENYPLTRYNTLREILERPESDGEVVTSREAMMNSSPINNILAQQRPEGNWLKDAWVKKYGLERAVFGYLPKYKATYHNLLMLTDANVPHDDPRIHKLGNFILSNNFYKGFSSEEYMVLAKKWENFTEDSPAKLMTLYTGMYQLKQFPDINIPWILACIIARMTWAMVKLGFSHQPEVRSTFDFLIKYQRFDNGDRDRPRYWPYRGAWGCWGKPRSCYAGIVSLLQLMTVIPKDYWTAASRIAKENAINYVLNQRLIHSQYKQTVRDLQQLSVPSLRPDAIEIATTLLQLGVKDSTIDEVVEFIISKANHQGRWVAEKVHSNTYGQWGKKGEENKWITFRVLRMLKIADRL